MLESGAISEIALIFVTNDDFDVQLKKALAIVGEKLGVSYCHLFLDSPDGATTSNTHEWCAQGMDPLSAFLQNVPYSKIPSWSKVLQSATVSAVENVDGLPDDLRHRLELLGVRAFIVAPFYVGGRIRGFLSFDECTKVRAWSKLEIETLKTITGIVTTAYSKKLLTDQLSISGKNFRGFFNTVDDIIVIVDLEGMILFANEGTTRKLGYALEELRGQSVFMLHPADRHDAVRKILEGMRQREISNHPFELVAQNGMRIPVETRVWFGQWDGQDCIFGLSRDLSAEQAALQKFEMLFRNNPATMAISTESERRLMDVNNAFLDKFGYSLEEVIGKTSDDLVLVIDDEDWRKAREDIKQYGSVRNRKLLFRRKDGELIHGLLSGDSFDILGQRCLLSVMIDLTSQVSLQEKLATEHSRLTNIIEGTRLGTWEWNIQTGETKFNERWAEMLGHTLSELSPVSIKTWQNLAHPDDLKESDRLLQRHFEGITDFYECEVRMRHRNGSWVWVFDRGKLVERDDAGRPLMMYGTHTDITEQKTLEQRIHELAIRDPLTEIYNRRYIFERLDEIVAEYERVGRNFCISILDIDHFKAVNDTYGHQAGDFVLREFALTIGNSIRQYDLLGRYGGEEFIIVSPNVGSRETVKLIERIMVLVRQRALTFKGKEIRFTFSCGVADSSELPRQSFSIEALVSLADDRLYAAKEGGRDCCVGP